MGAHSTIRITRTAAQRYIMTEFLTMGDEQLERIMDTLLEGRLYNVRFVSDDEENDDGLL